MRAKILFHVDAGKYEPDGELNYKYCDQAETVEGAVQMYGRAYGYDFVEFYMTFEVDGAVSTIWIEGGPMLEQQMRMSFAHLWAVATGSKFVDVAADWEKQAEDIERVLLGLSPVSWQDVYRSFEAGEFTWTEAFEALMNKCGYSPEDALKCLAENFNRRPALVTTEVSDENC